MYKVTFDFTHEEKVFGGYLSIRQMLYIIFSVVTIIIGATIHAIHLKFYGEIFAIFGVMLLFLYNGKRGKTNLKYFFYLFYPLHFVFIYAIQLLISGKLF